MAISQTDKIFGSILIAFIIYVTLRGQLPAYFQIFTPAPATPSNNQALTTQIGGVVGQAGDALGNAGDYAKQIVASTIQAFGIGDGNP